MISAKYSRRFVNPVVDHQATVRDAIEVAIEGGLSAMMVLNTEKHVLGLITSRDLLRIMSSGFQEGTPAETVVDRRVIDYMVPVEQVVYARPYETIGVCRTLMGKLGIKCLPVLSLQGQVEGIITARDMSDYGLTAKEKGGKEAYLNDVSRRVGLLTKHTSMAEPPAYLKTHLADQHSPIYANVGVAELPHPFKTKHGIGRSLNGTYWPSPTR